MDSLPPGPPSSAPISCLDENDVLAFVTGVLAPEAREQSARHLDACWACTQLVSSVAAELTPEETGPARLGAFGMGEDIAGRYHVLRLVGAGGMGEVYEVRDTALGETVALKTIGLGIPLDGVAIARLKAEVQLARRVTDRRVCRVFDLGFHEQPDPSGRARSITIPFLTMELLSGETLRAHLLRVGRVPCQQAATLLAEMAAGLSAAHGAGVVHADFKSENIMLVPQPGGVRPVIMDFGLARPLETTSRLSRSGKKLVAGTVGYMAPEQLDGRRASEASDVYALGVVFFEMLTGRLPFAGTTALAAAVEAITLAPPSVRAHGVEAPPAFDAVVARCLQVDPGQRFPSAAQVIPALHAPSPRSARRGRPATAAAAIAAVLATIGAVAWWSHGRRPERTERPPVAAVPLAPLPPPPPAPPAPLPLPAAPSPSQPVVAAPERPAHKRPARTRRVPEAAPPAATDPLLGERL
jgi:hypothetical protein